MSWGSIDSEIWMVRGASGKSFGHVSVVPWQG